MKDILFTVKQQKREIWFISASFLLATVVNMYAIILYGTEWKELYTQWFTLLVLTVFFYIVFGIFRLIYWLILYISQKRKDAKTINIQ